MQNLLFTCKKNFEFEKEKKLKNSLDLNSIVVAEERGQ